ncbi:MAG: heavy metal translocating P-type ATPase [Clostridia bacterium]|nr:heavy metal translocating P-type ATPase [Clostridia bacterium]
MKLSRSQKRKLYEILGAAALLIAAVILSAILKPTWWAAILLYLPAFVLAGHETITSALRNILRGQVFDEHFLMSVASIAAMILGEHAEAVGVLLFGALGELFESYAISSARRSVKALAKLCPDTVRVVSPDGNTSEIAAETAEAGTVFLVAAGERIPLDGIILEGEAALDCAALTGESLPVEVEAGHEVAAGAINLSGLLKIRALRPAKESGAARIIAMVEDASAKKARSEAFITKFARYYTPIVVGAALLLAIVPPLIFGGFTDWLYRALNFLVISCPCALVISVPLTFFGTIGGSARRGILFKDNYAIENLSAAKIAAFDKTGTLTEGHLSIDQIRPVSCTPNELIAYAAAAEYGSTHPIAKTVLEAFEGIGGVIGGVAEQLSQSTELRGRGRTCSLGGVIIAAGNRKLLEEMGVQIPSTEENTTVIYVSVDGQYRGSITFSDRIKADSAEAIGKLRNVGVGTVMLSGDNRNGAEKVAAQLGISRFGWGLLPEEKVTALESYRPEGGKLIFVGDGINDAPSLAATDVGIAMGGIGSDAAIEAADVVLPGDNPLKVAEAVRISKKAMAIAKQNIVFAIGIKVLFLILSAFGLTNMWMSVFADVGVSVLAILNAMRTLK